jgi:predicted Zn-dependent protease
MRSTLILVSLAIFFISCSKSDDAYVNNPGIPDYLHNRPVGASANELLASGTYKSLKIEIQYMPGFAPDQGAVNYLQTTLVSLLNKPSGISIVTKEIGGSADKNFSVNEIIETERTNRTAFSSGDQIAVYILYTDGSYTSNNVLGIAYKNTSAVLMGKTIHENSGALGQVSRTKLEATVLTHEIGHLLGLVDLGSPMQTNHKDAAHGNHCDNTSCLMHYASETTDILGFLLTGNIPEIDADCRADLQANGGK